MSHELDLEQEFEGPHDKSAEAGQKKKEARIAKDLVNPNATGGFEKRAIEMGALGETLHTSAAVKNDIGSGLVEYETGYNMHTAPLKSTLRSMGRLKDMQSAGAHMDPAALSADKALAGKFHKVSFTEKAGATGHDGDARAAYNQWTEQQQEMEVATVAYEAGQQILVGAIHHFTKAQMMLQKRSKQGEMEGVKAKKGEIDAAADTLVDIVNVSMSALNAVSTIDSMVNKTFEASDTSASEHAYGGGKQTQEEFEAADKAETKANSTTSKQQSLGSMAERSGNAIKAHAGKVQGWLDKGGVSLKDIMIVAMGDAAAYDKYTKQIEKLKQQLAALDLDIENEEIKSAETSLNGFQLDLAARKKMVSIKTLSTRAASQTFAQQLDSGTGGVLAMMTAEAYQELAMNGAQADQQRHQIDRFVPWLDRVVGDKKLRFEAEGWGEDFNAIRHNVISMYGEKEHFATHLPEWKSKAAAWKSFLAEMMGG
jgi:hypothetical protein